VADPLHGFDVERASVAGGHPGGVEHEDLVSHTDKEHRGKAWSVTVMIVTLHVGWRARVGGQRIRQPSWPWFCAVSGLLGMRQLTNLWI
jgi:hypothetical protein